MNRGGKLDVGEHRVRLLTLDSLTFLTHLSAVGGGPKSAAGQNPIAKSRHLHRFLVREDT